MAARKIHPVLLSGGSGTRLWPLSRELYPKQFFPLLSERTLLQETAARAADPAVFAAPLVVCNHEHRFVVAEQLREAGITPAEIALEPEGRNTAAAAAVAAEILGGGTLLLLMPCDHAVTDRDAFVAAVQRAVPAAVAGAIVTFGMTPDAPETGYGYIERGAALAGMAGCYGVARFKEKPDADTARKMIGSGRWYWNSGMFLATAATLLEEIGKWTPATASASAAAVQKAVRDLDFLRLDAGSFAPAPAVSLDHAVLEKTARAAVVPAEMGWSDVGSWTALWRLGAKDADENVVSGDVVTEDVRGSYIRSDSQLVAAIGLSDVVLVVTDDAVLAAPRGRAGEVKVLVESLRAEKRAEALTHRRVYRPWGHYERLGEGDRFQVKRITVKPNGVLSLQRHAKRAEHWVVVNGTAKVTRGGETFHLNENESTYIPAGVAHRLENAAGTPLCIIEVQSGAYLGEDDIERIEDSYGRAPRT